MSFLVHLKITNVIGTVITDVALVNFSHGLHFRKCFRQLNRWFTFHKYPRSENESFYKYVHTTLEKALNATSKTLRRLRKERFEPVNNP